MKNIEEFLIFIRHFIDWSNCENLIQVCLNNYLIDSTVLKVKKKDHKKKINWVKIMRHLNVQPKIPTDAAIKFLHTLSDKKKGLKRNRQNDLHIYAVVSSAFCRIQNDLRRQQQERAAKWAMIKYKAMEAQKLASEEETIKEKMIKDKLWNEDLVELNNFLNNLSQIKTTIVR